MNKSKMKSTNQQYIRLFYSSLVSFTSCEMIIKQLGNLVYIYSGTH